MAEAYPLIIIGGGPAGLTAGIYAGRSHLKTLIIAEQPGGAIGYAHRVQNFPGFPEISGLELANRLMSHLQEWPVELLTARVGQIIKKDNSFLVSTDQNQEYRAEALLLALGTEKKKLGLPDEDRFLGRGLSYCALCDGQFFKNKTVAVGGSGDAAVTMALYLAEMTNKVFLISLQPELNCNPSWYQIVKNQKKIELICDNQVMELIGSDKLSSIKLKNPYQRQTELPVEGLFVEIGSAPSTTLTAPLNLATDPEGFIEIKANGRTSQPAIWAAGDLTSGSNKLRQAITAAAEGAIAADDIYRYFKQKG